MKTEFSSGQRVRVTLGLAPDGINHVRRVVKARAGQLRGAWRHYGQIGRVIGGPIRICGWDMYRVRFGNGTDNYAAHQIVPVGDDTGREVAP